MAWGAIIPYILAAASAAQQMNNQRQTHNRQDGLLAQQINRNAARQNEASQAIDETMQQRAATSGEDVRKATADQYLQQVRAAMGNATGGLNQAGNVSDAYRQSAENAALGIGDYAGRTADLMARIDAPVQMRQGEALGNRELGMTIGEIARNGRHDDFLTQLKLARVRPDPWGQLAAAGLGVASGYGAQAGWGQEPLANIRGKALLDADMAAKSQQLNRRIWGA